MSSYLASQTPAALTFGPMVFITVCAAVVMVARMMILGVGK
ncbi:hypothetical protein [Methylobacterium sp. Leaf399]|nr:hypothetical protein [Methylobacterium sp. Leaf399]